MGTALTERQLKELSRLTNRVWLCFDGDAAGRDGDTARHVSSRRRKALTFASSRCPRVSIPPISPRASMRDWGEPRRISATACVSRSSGRRSSGRFPFACARFSRASRSRPNARTRSGIAADKLDLPKETQQGLAPSKSASIDRRVSARLLDAGERLEQNAPPAWQRIARSSRVLAELRARALRPRSSAASRAAPFGAEPEGDLVGSPRGARRPRHVGGHRRARTRGAAAAETPGAADPPRVDRRWIRPDAGAPGVAGPDPLDRRGTGSRASVFSLRLRSYCLRIGVTIVAMRDESDVWQALLKRKGLSVTDLRRPPRRDATARTQAADRVAGQRIATRRARAGACPRHADLGQPALWGRRRWTTTAELDLVLAGDAQPPFASRDRGDGRRPGARTGFAPRVCCSGLGPATPGGTLPASTPRGARSRNRESSSSWTTARRRSRGLAAIVEEIRSGLDATLRSRAQARDPGLSQRGRAATSAAKLAPAAVPGSSIGRASGC